MLRIKPVHAGIFVLAVVSVLIWVRGQGGRSDRTLVRPGPDGAVRIAIGDLGPNQVRFYHFLNSGNQEVNFFIGRDETGGVQVAFDASENHFKLRRGYRFENGWIVDNKCGSSFRLSAVNGGGGGCMPIPLHHRATESEVVLTEGDLLEGWRYFR